MSDRELALRIVDGFGHDLPAMTQSTRRSMIRWLDLEEAAGESSPGLRALREALLADEEADR